MKVKRQDVESENLWEKAGHLYECMVAVDAFCLFFGGGNIVNDEIQVARNLRARYLLMADIEGASGTHAQHLPNRTFRFSREVLSVVNRRIWDSPPVRYWYLGPNPIVDLVLLRNSPLGGGGDPRDTDDAWGETTVFLMHASKEISTLPIAGGDDASDAKWFSVNDLPTRLAFDHDKILRDVLSENS